MVNEEVTIWGAKENKQSGITIPKKERITPGFRHIFAGVFGMIATSILGIFGAGLYLLLSDPNLASDPQELITQLYDFLSSNIVSILSSLILLWLALTVPIFWAGRKYEGGWKKMIGWEFHWKFDIKVALIFAVSARLFEYISNLILSSFKIDTSNLTNGGLLESAGSKWLILLVVGASVGAPIAEELFFRGLILKVVARKFGKILGVIVSATLFGLMHSQATLSGTIYMFISTSIIGVFLAIIVLKTNRLGTAILAHGAFNASAGLLVILGL